MTVKYLHFRFLRERGKYVYRVLKRIMHRRTESSTDAIFTCVYVVPTRPNEEIEDESSP